VDKKRRMNRIKYVLLLSLLVLFGYETIARSQAERLPPVRLGDLRTGAHSLLVGGVADFHPFNSVGPNGELTGMDREILRAIAKRVGIQSIEFKTMLFSELSDALESGTIDVIANNYWITPERQRLFIFTYPYYRRGGVGVVYLKSAGGNYRSAKDLAGKRIAVFKGSYEEQWVGENITNANIIPLDSSVDDLNATLTNGQADAVVAYYSQEKDALKGDQSGQYDMVLLQPMRAAFAARKSDVQLRDMLNDGLRKLAGDGSLVKIKGTYLDPLGIEPAASLQEQ